MAPVTGAAVTYVHDPQVSRLLLAFVLICAWPSPAAAGQPLIPPVDGAVQRRFQAPGTDWGPGHRGIDLQVSPGVAVKAAGSGKVTFAGAVPGGWAVSIVHGEGLETTYSLLDGVTVAAGQEVAQGQWIGRAGRAHPGAPSGLHLGVKVEGAYEDPLRFFGPVDVGTAIHLVPVAWEPPETMENVFAVPPAGPLAPPPCVPAALPSGALAPPNDNVAVAVAGIGSHTEGGVAASIYENGPELLGYPRSRVYRFSYAGIEGPGLHRPYRAQDTFGDLRHAAQLLRTQLAAIGRRHPGTPVDLIAHSQGGIVAAAYLKLVATAWDPELPPVAHLVTFSSPHSGAPLAGTVPGLGSSAPGRALLRAVTAAADRGTLPRPDAPSVAQLAPGSPLLAGLAGRDLLFGTRALALAIPNDAIVPASQAELNGEEFHVVAPAGLNGHDAITASPEARAVAYGFLRDAPPACLGSWDLWGPRIGSALATVEASLPAMASALEDGFRGLLHLP